MPPRDEILDADTNNVGGYPIEGQSAGQGKREEGDHQRHQPQHHHLVRRLTGVGRRGHGHLLLEPGGDEDQDWNDYVGRVRLRQVHPKKGGAKGRGGVDGEVGYPGIEFLRQGHQVVGPRVHRLYQNAEQPEKYGHLDDQWPQAAHRIDPRLPVEPHCFLGDPLPVPAVTVLDFPHPRLQVHHCPHLPQLFYGQRKGDHADNDGKDYDRNTHVVEADGVEHHQQVQHGANDYFSPEIVDTQKGLPHRREWNSAPSFRPVVQIAEESLHQRHSSSCFQHARAVKTASENCSCTSTRRALPSSEPTYTVSPTA